MFRQNLEFVEAFKEFQINEDTWSACISIFEANSLSRSYGSFYVLFSNINVSLKNVLTS